MSHSEKQSGTRAARILRTAGYWLVSLTWGSIMTLLGAVIALGMLLTGHRPGRLGPNVYFEVGCGWAGWSTARSSLWSATRQGRPSCMRRATASRICFSGR